MGTTKKSAGGSRPVTKADLELDDPKRNMALVIKRMKQIAKEDTNRFEKMGMSETLARLEQSEKVAASVEAAHATEMTRKRALLSAFVASGTTPPAPATRDETPTQNVSTNVAKTATANDGDAAEEMTDEQTLEMAKRKLAETQANSRSRLAAAKNARVHNDEMVAALEAAGVEVPEDGKVRGEA
jgi:hypothetical protein